MHVDVDRGPCRVELAPPILERADQFTLLRIDGDRGLARRDLATQGLVDMLELRIPIGMLRALKAFPIGLQPVAEIVQQPGHHLHARGVALLTEGVDEVALTARRPQQRRHRIATRRRLDQGLQIRQQRRILRRGLLAPPARTTTAGRGQGPGLALLDRLHVPHAPRDRRGGHARGARRGGDAAVPKGDRLARHKQSPRALGQSLPDLLIALSNLSLGHR
jgi:hypothetical protein